MGGVQVTKRTYTVAEVAKLMGLSAWAIYDHLKDDSFPVKPIRMGKRILFSSVLIDTLLTGEQAS